MRISLIVAMSENRVIGRNNQLPWHLPRDLQHFKRTTLHHTVIMGRKTFESMGKPLPQRRNIVITRDRTYRAAGIEIAHGLDEAISLCKNEDEIFIAGGAEIFRQALHGADRMYLTLIHAKIEGDVYFPEVNWKEWTLLSDERFEADETNQHAMSFRTFEHIRFSQQPPV
jgi:dihydrofolate reductase